MLELHLSVNHELQLYQPTTKTEPFFHWKITKNLIDKSTMLFNYSKDLKIYNEQNVSANDRNTN